MVRGGPALRLHWEREGRGSLGAEALRNPRASESHPALSKFFTKRHWDHDARRGSIRHSAASLEVPIRMLGGTKTEPMYQAFVAVAILATPLVIFNGVAKN
ncbi:hypothetical protein NDU88_005628 [Pleurodeles waltl]|uniref:Uncharacterized protein n=1 Tax=Pleurodeles waltl TaxID=8319 RepID=A0AAV7VM72_PLEWA|nr:hypothetical protein NDU88_005628 [Pleurodeles waltl]